MLTIAHRLQTIIDSDKVLLIGDGKKMEFGAPPDLLKDEKSLFKKLVDRMQNLGAKTGKEEKKDE
jgi:ABC-type multidrug transport system fused ATPase/permease subunit